MAPKTALAEVAQCRRCQRETRQLAEWAQGCPHRWSRRVVVALRNAAARARRLLYSRRAQVVALAIAFLLFGGGIGGLVARHLR